MTRGRVNYGIGVFFGLLLSWVFFLLSFLRGARFFHPSGVVYSGWALPASGIDNVAEAQVAARLAGAVVVRFSGGLFKSDGRGVRRDSLGLGMRFHCQPGPCSTDGSRGCQDLFLVSFRSFRAMAHDIMATNPNDYLANTYWTVVPYEVEGLGRVSLRITPSRVGASGKARDERLEDAVRAGMARLRLEVAPLGTDDYRPLAELRLQEWVDWEEALHLSPRASGSGLRPIGFLQGLRVAPYAASYLARRLRNGPPGRGGNPEAEPAGDFNLGTSQRMMQDATASLERRRGGTLVRGSASTFSLVSLPALFRVPSFLGMAGRVP